MERKVKISKDVFTLATFFLLIGLMLVIPGYLKPWVFIGVGLSWIISMIFMRDKEAPKQLQVNPQLLYAITQRLGNYARPNSFEAFIFKLTLSGTKRASARLGLSYLLLFIFVISTALVVFDIWINVAKVLVYIYSITLFLIVGLKLIARLTQYFRFVNIAVNFKIPVNEVIYLYNLYEQDLVDDKKPTDEWTYMAVYNKIKDKL